MLDRAENVDGALSSAIRSMVCTDVFSQAIERVENIRDLRPKRLYDFKSECARDALYSKLSCAQQQDTFHGNGRNWLAHIPCRCKTYRLLLDPLLKTRCCARSS